MNYTKETPALNADGTYKEANEMEWDDDKSPPQTPLSSLPSGNASSGSTFTFRQQLGPEDYMDTSGTSGTNTNTSGAGKASRKGKERATDTASTAASSSRKKKPAAIERVRSRSSLASEQAGSISSPAPTSDAGEDDDEESQPQKKRRRGDGYADVRTIFSPVDSNDLKKGWRCNQCTYVLSFYSLNTFSLDCYSDLKKAYPLKYGKLQLIFTGNTTSLRNHIARMGMDHYDLYRERCIEQDIEMSERCVPTDEKARLEGKGDGLRYVSFCHC